MQVILSLISIALFAIFGVIQSRAHVDPTSFAVSITIMVAVSFLYFVMGIISND